MSANHKPPRLSPLGKSRKSVTTPSVAAVAPLVKPSKHTAAVNAKLQGGGNMAGKGNATAAGAYYARQSNRAGRQPLG